MPVANERIEFFTVGYEGKTLAAFLELLLDAGVERIVDVRELPLSRKKGFSKTRLSKALERRGIDYVHVRSAGNPHRDLRDDTRQCLAAYAEHLRAHPSALDDVIAALRGFTGALLCVENDHAVCHRSVLARRLARRKNVTIAGHL